MRPRKRQGLSPAHKHRLNQAHPFSSHLVGRYTSRYTLASQLQPVTTENKRAWSKGKRILIIPFRRVLWFVWISHFESGSDPARTKPVALLEDDMVLRFRCDRKFDSNLKISRDRRVKSCYICFSTQVEFFKWFVKWSHYFFTRFLEIWTICLHVGNKA